MSVVQSSMFTNRLNSPFVNTSHHGETSSFNELFASLQSRSNYRKMKSLSPTSFSSPELSTYTKKRSHSDQSNTRAVAPPAPADLPSPKRAKTVPSSPVSLDKFSITPFHSAEHAAHDLPTTKVTLPSLNDALANISGSQSPSTRLGSVKPLIPTVSLDYFDTYKPNDENWRYGLLDSIRSTKPTFSLDSYAHNDRLCSSTQKLPSFNELQKSSRPRFDSRVGTKALPTFAERKINFPYESNYTYLNKTYLNDVERYPEYLELAQSLVSLSRPPEFGPVSGQQQSNIPLHSVHQHYEHPHHEHQRQHQQQQQQPQHMHHSYSSHSHSHRHMDEFRSGHHEHSGKSHEHSFKPQYASYGSSSHYRNHVLSPPSAQSTTVAYATPDHSFELKSASPISQESAPQSQHQARFIPITPPSVKDKTRSDLMKSPGKSSQGVPRCCISCGSDQSPCWRPSWSIKEGQLCNSCGLRYKKTAARCLNSDCKKIPAKGEWALMQSKGKTRFEDGEPAYACLNCGWKVEVRK